MFRQIDTRLNGLNVLLRRPTLVAGREMFILEIKSWRINSATHSTFRLLLSTIISVLSGNLHLK